jgi:hypothetical protein
MKSGNLNFLEPSGPLQAGNGTALPLPLHKYVATCFNQLCGHPQVIRTHKNKTTIADFNLGHNEISVLLFYNAY